MNKLIGLAGTNGSGKDTVGGIIADKYDYSFVSVTDLLREEARRLGQPLEREVLRTISARWRRQSGLGVLVDRAVADYPAKSDYKGLVIASLRNPGEADRIHQLGGVVVWIDADPSIRYHRIQTNATQRARAAEDSKSFNQFLAEESVEMQQSGDRATLNMAAVKAKADYYLTNNGSEIASLAKTIDQTLHKTP